ncbi:MAG: hypothetical protein ACI8PW_001099 [Methylophilaceae bacterium]|jgi:hypothetical protein
MQSVLLSVSDVDLARTLNEDAVSSDLVHGLVMLGTLGCIA